MRGVYQRWAVCLTQRDVEGKTRQVYEKKGRKSTWAERGEDGIRLYKSEEAAEQRAERLNKIGNPQWTSRAYVIGIITDRE